MPVFIEEGRYKEIETFNIPTCPQSIRLVKEDMGSPELYLASSTNYEGMQLKNKIYTVSKKGYLLPILHEYQKMGVLCIWIKYFSSILRKFQMIWKYFQWDIFSGKKHTSEPRTLFGQQHKLWWYAVEKQNIYSQQKIIHPLSHKFQKMNVLFTWIRYFYTVFRKFQMIRKYFQQDLFSVTEHISKGQNIISVKSWLKSI